MEAVGHQLLPCGEHVGDDVLSEIVGRLGICLIIDKVAAQLLPGKDVDAHRGEVALGLGGLLLELIDLVVLVHVHDAEALGLVHGDLQHGDGAGGTGLLVQVHHVGIVHLVDVVAGEDDYIVRIIQVQEADILIDGVGSPLVPGALVALAHVGGEDMYAAIGAVQVPGLARADVAVQLQRTVLGQNANCVDAGVDTVGQGKVDDAVLAAEGDRGLCYMAGQGVKPAALPSGQQHCHNFFLHLIHHLLD